MKAGFKDLERELWLRLRDKGVLVWQAKDGREIPIKDMEDTHLLNCYNMLRSKQKDDSSTYIDSQVLSL